LISSFTWFNFLFRVFFLIFLVLQLLLNFIYIRSFNCWTTIKCHFTVKILANRAFLFYWKLSWQWLLGYLYIRFTVSQGRVFFGWEARMIYLIFFSIHFFTPRREIWVTHWLLLNDLIFKIHELISNWSHLLKFESMFHHLLMNFILMIKTVVYSVIWVVHLITSIRETLNCYR